MLLDAEVCTLDPLSHSTSCRDTDSLHVHVRGCGMMQAIHLSLEGAGGLWWVSLYMTGVLACVR